MMQRRYAGFGFAAGVLGATAVLFPANAYADPADAESALLTSAGSLSDSSTAIFIGGTFEPTPSLTYVENAEKLFLNPLDFAGVAANASTVCDISGVAAPCDAPLQVLTTPELLEEGPSTLQTEQDIIGAVESEYNAGLLSTDHPLTVFAYSQSAMAASAAEQTLYNYGVPTDDLKFVFIGDPSTEQGIAPNIYADLVALFGGGSTGTSLTDSLLKGVNEDQYAPGGSLVGVTPNDLYDTTIYTIDTDGVADWQTNWDATLADQPGNYIGALFNDLYHFVTTHVEYLGLTPADIAAGTATTDGLTTTITLADHPEALLNLFTDGAADSGFPTALLGTIEGLFNPAIG